jgi:hypothetical protein
MSHTRLDSGRVQVPPAGKKSSPYPYPSPDGYWIPVPELPSLRTPMEVRLQLSKNGDTPAVDSTNYRSVVGSLRYMVNTYPDLAYSVGYVSRFMEAPREEHMMAVKCILRYLVGTKRWG